LVAAPLVLLVLLASVLLVLAASTAGKLRVVLVLPVLLVGWYLNSTCEKEKKRKELSTVSRFNIK
jgi:hypothetical protein